MLDGGDELENCLVLVRERAVDLGGGEWFVRATIHERDLSQHLRWDALSRGRGADGQYDQLPGWAGGVCEGIERREAIS